MLRLSSRSWSVHIVSFFGKQTLGPKPLCKYTALFEIMHVKETMPLPQIADSDSRQASKKIMKLNKENLHIRQTKTRCISGKCTQHIR